MHKLSTLRQVLIAIAGLAVLTLDPGGLTAPLSAGDTAKDLGFQVPEGFEVSLYADDALATDIHSMTIDAKGRIVVASKGYIKILHDTAGAGKADKATLFADFPKSGAHGMYFDGPDLICNGDKGVRRLYDTKGAGQGDKVSPVWFPTKNDGEHAANGIVRGPDGWYYMIAGNDAGISKDFANSPGSPIKAPSAGTVVRFSADGKKREVVAHGFRNPYDLAFNHLGQLFTVDADGERIHYMPYYAPTRLFDIAQGMHHGWLLPGWMRGWSRPAAWPDNVERLVEIGRGSPTGVVVYRHRAFPQRYRNGVFSLCWTFGKVYFFPLKENGSTYESKMEVFMRTTGDVGFAPTDMVVGPDGDLFIAIGGRGTRGSVFRVHYKGPPLAPPGRGDPLREVLAADEPLSSWSRARWVPAAHKLGKKAFLQAVSESKLPLVERIRAVEVLTELFGGVPAELAEKICAVGVNPELAARTVWSVSRSSDSDAGRKVLVKMTSAADPRIARAAWEALVALPSPLDEILYKPDWKAGLDSKDRRVRAATILAAKGPGRLNFLHHYPHLPEAARERLGNLWVRTLPSGFPGPIRIYENTCLDVITHEKDIPLRLEAVRLLQILMGDVDTDDGAEKAFIGYVARRTDKFDAEMFPESRKESTHTLAKAFPAGDARLDQELARLLAMMEAEALGLLERLADQWTAQSPPEQDIHYLLVLSRLPGPRSAEVTRKTALALNGIHVKLARLGAKPNDQVPGILEALLERLLRRDPALAKALVADAHFGVPGHALFAGKLPLAEKQAAARKLLGSIAKLDEEEARAAWSPELVRLAGSLPEDEALPILRTQFADPRLTDTVALLLVQKRRPEDRQRWLEALSSTQPVVVGAMAEALLALPPAKDKAVPVEIGKVVRALRRLESQKTDPKIKQTLVSLLESWSGQKLKPVNPKEEPAATWVQWFLKTYPKEAAALPGLASADFAAWKKRLDKIDWEGGDVRRGEVVFQRKNCYRCHGEARRLGPDLTGIAQRFSRDDLFTAIIDPSKDIAPAFKATTIVTKSGKIHNGMMIYESPDLSLLQTTPDTTVRIARAEVLLVQPSAISFMPAGLLDELSDADLRDLYAYLKSLRKG